MNNTSYNRIMDKVEMTPEMRERILKNVEASAKKQGKLVRLPMLRRALSAAACAVLLVAAAFLLPKLLDMAEANQPPVQIANGIEECASLDELSEKVGFEVRAPQALPFDPESIEYSSYWGDFAQVDYDGEGMHMTYRVSSGSGDISGDYNDYADTAKLSIGDAEVTLKGSVGNWQLAIWEEDGFAFSLSVSPGLSEAQLKDIIGNIK